MKKIYIKTTESCQLRCKHCYIGENRDHYNFFRREDTVRWIKKFIQYYHIKENEINFSFHGGEPFLCNIKEIQSFIHEFPHSQFDATSNLVFPITSEILYAIQHFRDGNHIPFIKTSWDYLIRFQTREQESLWENNVKYLMKQNIDVMVIICLTSKLLTQSPKDIYQFIQSLGVSCINFERLTINTTEQRDLIPDYSLQDQWLCEFYSYAKDSLRVILFEDMKLSLQKIFIGCRRRECMQQVITINTDGTIGGCPNTSLNNSFYSIDLDPTKFYFSNQWKTLCQKEKLRNPACYTCELYEYCQGDCHQLSFHNGICAVPKKLYRMMLHEMGK